VCVRERERECALGLQRQVLYVFVCFRR